MGRFKIKAVLRTHKTIPSYKKGLTLGANPICKTVFSIVSFAVTLI